MSFGALRAVVSFRDRSERRGTYGVNRMRYMLRSRMDDNSKWSEPEEFTTRRERDQTAAMARIYGGIRTHSYEERGTNNG